MTKEKPTEKQIFAWMRLTKWVLLTAPQLKATEFIKSNVTREQLSRELFRIRNLYIKHELDRDTVFASPIWCNFKEDIDNVE